MICISVILVTYNSESTIQRTLDSVINQRGRGLFFNLELIVVDDCSTDNTTRILRSNNISYQKTLQNSGGPNKGRNIALRMATGDFICFIDHDDVWMPEKLLLQLKASHYAQVITTGYSIHYPNGSKINRVLHDKEPVLFRMNETFLDKLKKKNGRQNTYLSTIMISSTLKEIYFEEHFGLCDFDWLLRILENRSTIEIPQVLMKRYLTGANLSLDDDYRKKDYYYSLYSLESYEERYSKEVKQGRKRIHGSRARYYYLIDKMKKARAYFIRSQIDLKTIGFIITSFVGSTLIRKTFRFFG